MNGIKLFALAAVAGIGFTVATTGSQAQISVNIGTAPNCPYGYYETAPYGCAPYGYYGPEWFTGGAFIGAGPWFHGPANFHGHVDNHFHPDHGYKGAMPARGEHATPEHSRPPAKAHLSAIKAGHSARLKDGEVR